jgi:transposase
MPNVRLAMILIRDILRLKYESGLSHRQIAAALHISVGSVTNYLADCASAGLVFPLADELTDEMLTARLAKNVAAKVPLSPQFALPDFAVLHEQLKLKGVTRQLLWEEYAAAHPARHYRYTQFCFYYRQWRQKLKVSLRQSYTAGEKMFVDYCGKTVEIVNAATGEVRQAQVFVAVLGASNYTFAEATETQKLADWIGSHTRAFEFFGGVPELVIPDNLKSAVRKACRYEPLLNESYQRMLEHYRTCALPARPYKPRDKAKVETAVQVVTRWILARLRNQTFFSLFDLNLAIRALLAELNAKPFKKLTGCRRSRFAELDQPALKSLPAAAYEYAEWRKARVGFDCHIEVDRRFYSVPYALVKNEIDVRLTAKTVECFHQADRPASALNPHRQLCHARRTSA